MGHSREARAIQNAKVELAGRTLKTKEQVPSQLASILATAHMMAQFGLVDEKSLIRILLERYENGQDDAGDVPEFVRQSLLSELITLVQAYFGFDPKEPSPPLRDQKPYFGPQKKHRGRKPSTNFVANAT